MSITHRLHHGERESDQFVELPLERAQAYRALVDAARNWRQALIPKTSTATYTEVRNLLRAVAFFDTGPAVCTHPATWLVCFPEGSDQPEICGYCGQERPLDYSDQ